MLSSKKITTFAASLYNLIIYRPMKKTFSLLLVLFCSLTLWAEHFVHQHIYYNTTSDSTAVVHCQTIWSTPKYNHDTLVIPQTVDYYGKTYRIVGIVQSAFADFPSLITVSIPNTVTTIGIGAFSECTNLNKILIPSSVDTIGSAAFGYCTSLKEVTCLATIPPTCGDLVLGEYEIFYGVNVANIPLYVPAESIELYKKADHWKDFGQILPIEDLNKSLIGEWQYVGREDKDCIVSISDSLIYNHPFGQSHRYTASASQLYLERLWTMDDAPHRWEACNYSLNGDTLWIDNFWMGFMWVTVYPPILYDITLIRKKDVANDVDSPTSTSPFSKTLHNGQLLIFRDDKTYNIMGVEITK